MTGILEIVAQAHLEDIGCIGLQVEKSEAEFDQWMGLLGAKLPLLFLTKKI